MYSTAGNSASIQNATFTLQKDRVILNFQMQYFITYFYVKYKPTH